MQPKSLGPPVPGFSTPKKTLGGGGRQPLFPPPFGRPGPPKKMPPGAKKEGPRPGPLRRVKGGDGGGRRACFERGERRFGR